MPSWMLSNIPQCFPSSFGQAMLADMAPYASGSTSGISGLAMHAERYDLPYCPCGVCTDHRSVWSGTNSKTSIPTCPPMQTDICLPWASEDMLRDSSSSGTTAWSDSNEMADWQCWEHGCNGRKFSTRSNLTRHQKERSGARAGYKCLWCAAIFTRTSTRNTHMLNKSCMRIRRFSNGRERPTKARNPR